MRPTLSVILVLSVAAGWADRQAEADKATTLPAAAGERERNDKEFIPVKGADHFSTLVPVTRLIAQKIHRDTGATTNLTFDQAEVGRAYGK